MGRDAIHNVQMHMAVSCEILRSSSFSPCPAGAVDHCQSALFLLLIMALPTGDPELHALAMNCKVPEEYLSYLDGMNLELFSCIATTRDGIDKALEDLLADSPLPGAGPERVRLMASFRLLWERCSGPQQPTAQATVPKSSTWSEPFPPKLSGEAITQHRRAFESSYPGEVVDNDSMPGARMMALATKLSQPGEMRWIAWKHRLSKAQEESQALKRPAKVPRLEELFYDEIPTRELPQGMVGVGFVQSILGLVSTSFALLGKAHLHNLRLYERKFLKLAFQKHEASSGLRQLNLEETQCADRKVWELLSDLVNLHNWSLNDALTEVCEVRGDLASLLQPRPAIPKVQYHGKGFGKPSHPGKGKGKGGGHPSSGKGRQQNQWVLQFQDPVKGKRILCRGYSSKEGCRFENCKFEHLCPIPGSDGKPCLGKHPAYLHRSHAN